jgi:radical SAM superfamily enzyme YgiQ (UPF0313 family)
MSPEPFHLVLIKPSHYDDDGYVIQWLRSAMPSNTLAVLHSLALDCEQRRVLGDHVQIRITACDEMNTRIRPRRLIRQLRGKRALVGMVGVQTNQFPRAMDIARPLRAAGIQVCMGGFHVSGCLAMLPDMPPELREAIDLGISLFAGEAEGRLDEVLRDAWDRALKPLYNYLDRLPALEGAPLPLLPAERIRRTAGRFTSFDAGRGCPFRCSFCTIINVQGRKSRHRSADEVETIVRSNLAQGINRFFITDDDFARNQDWERIFDRLIAMRNQERLDIKFSIQVDTMCHRLPGFIEKAARAGVKRVFIGIENIHAGSLLGARKKQNQTSEYRKMLLEWRRVGVVNFCGYIVGFPGDTPESVRRDIGIIQRELPIDCLWLHLLTPLPGSEDHQRLYNAGVALESDLNKYDLEHVTVAHPTMSAAELDQVFRNASRECFTPAHMETVLRRSAASKRMNTPNTLFLLMWFYTCIVLENVDPAQGGFLRRKYRTDRRPGLPRENALIFYPRCAAELLSKHVRLARLYSRLYRLCLRLKRDPDALKHLDTALTFVSDSESGSLEMFRVVAG